VAAQVGSLVDVSRTGATAGSDTSSADASVVRLFEQPLLGLGGSQQGDGQSGGALLDTQSTLPARAQLAPWATSVNGSRGPTRHARSSAAVARADVPDIAHAGVLSSDSEATHTDSASKGTAVTEGFQLGILDAISLVLLHSEVSSEGRGHSYLVGLNGTELGTDEQLGASPLCALNAPGLLSLSCLSASGGGSGAAGGVGDAAAQVAEVTPALDVLNILDPVAAFTSAASSGTGEPAAAAAPEATTTQGTETSRATSPAAAPAGGNAASALPRTGATVASMAASALALLLLGVALRRFRLRPATVMTK
jgi:hypothetical protein